MEIFNNKFLVKLIASICLFLTLFNVAGTTQVYAGDAYVLLSPIVHLFTAIADGIVNIMHRVVLEQKETLAKIRGYSGWERFWRIFAVVAVTIVAIVVAAVIAYFTAGIGAYVAAAVAGTTVTITAGMITSAVTARNIGRSNCWCCC